MTEPGLPRQAINWLRYGCVPVACLDGDIPPEKEQLLQQRCLTRSAGLTYRVCRVLMPANQGLTVLLAQGSTSGQSTNASTDMLLCCRFSARTGREGGGTGNYEFQRHGQLIARLLQAMVLPLSTLLGCGVIWISQHGQQSDTW